MFLWYRPYLAGVLPFLLLNKKHYLKSYYTKDQSILFETNKPTLLWWTSWPRWASGGWGGRWGCWSPRWCKRSSRILWRSKVGTGGRLWAREGGSLSLAYVIYEEIRWKSINIIVYSTFYIFKCRLLHKTWLEQMLLFTILIEHQNERNIFGNKLFSILVWSNLILVSKH